MLAHEAKLSPHSSAEVRRALAELRELLTEVSVAAKLAREVPSEAATAPRIDAIRARVRAALEQCAKIAEMIERQQSTEADEATGGTRRANETSAFVLILTA